MSDERPRPKFGAYASNEEQLARINEHMPQPVMDPALIPQDMPPEDPARAARPGSREPVGQLTMVDRVVTVALLAFGLYTVLGSIGTYLDPYSLLDLLGMKGTTLTDPGALKTAGVVSTVLMLLGWAVTVWLVWRRGARRKSMWWIAVIAGIVFTIMGAMIVAVAFAMDPAVLDGFANLQGIELPEK